MLRILFFIAVALMAGNSYACKLARTVVDFNVTYQPSALPQMPKFRIVNLQRGVKPDMRSGNSCASLDKLGTISLQLPVNTRRDQGYIFEVVEGNIGDNTLFSKKPVRLLDFNSDVFDFRWTDYPYYYQKPIRAKIKITAVALSGRKSAPQFIYIRPAGEKTRAVANISAGAHAHNGRIHTHILPGTGFKHMHGNSAYGIPVKQQVQRKVNASTSRANFVAHSHNGRVHTHVLPKSGFRHKHGNSAYAMPVKQRQKTVVRKPVNAQFVPHSHGGRVHSHALPRSGVRHSHGGGPVGQLVTGHQNVATTKNYIPTYIATAGPAIVARGNLFSVKDVSYGSWPRLHPPIVIANYKIRPSDQALKKFRTTLDRLNVWNWKKRYYSSRTEAWKNSVTIAYPDKKVSVDMVSKNPENYNAFMDALLELVQHKQHAISREEFARKLRALSVKR